MEMKFCRRNYGFAAVLVLFLLGMLELQGLLAQDASCLNRLAPCLNYLDGTQDVPDTCCDPLKSVIKSNPECLCGLISNKGSSQAEQAGINVTEAQQLPGKCGQHVNPLGCLTGSPGSKTSVQDSSASALQSLMVAIVFSALVQILLA